VGNCLPTGAYSRIRHQFNMPIGRFEGIVERIARISGLAYIMDGARKMTAGAIDLGEVPSVPSAIVKYHLTEMGRVCANDAMDVHGGKGIMLGPKNYLARGYQAVPVAITVEGANILTRSMIIFGQGAMRCHPYVLKEIEAANNPDPMQALDDFDQALFGHIGHVIQNAARSFVLALTFARFDNVPMRGPTRRYYQHIDRFCAAFALVADAAMLTLGGALKKKEGISARLGDILSYMYLASATLKHWEEQGRKEEDLPLVEWGCRHLLYQAQEQLHGLMRNFPNRWVAAALRLFVFPRGRTYFAPSDRLEGRVAKLMINVTESRARLAEGLYTTAEPTNPIGLLEELLPLAIAAEPLERKLRQAVRDGKILEARLDMQVKAAVEAGVLTKDEAKHLMDVDAKIMNIVDVDDFEPHELGTKAKKKVVRKKRATKKKATRKKAAAEPEIKPDLEPEQPSGPI
ncbi:MAG: acyl-CoA dehydrogenase domain-containing protein, partial [Pseudomonadota bacterium]